jgi:hypothetical protein
VVQAGSKEDQILAFVFGAGAAAALVAAAGVAIGAVFVHRAHARARMFRPWGAG